VSVPQNAALSGSTAWRHIEPNKLSNAKTDMPTEKHQVESEWRFRNGAVTANAKLKIAAAKAKIVLRSTTCSYATKYIPLQTRGMRLQPTKEVEMPSI